MLLKKQNKQLKYTYTLLIIVFFCVSVVGVIRLILSLFNTYKTIDLIFAYSLWSYAFAYVLIFGIFIAYFWFRKK
jgi:multidrug transporter EmrE-like cation transporter